MIEIVFKALASYLVGSLVGSLLVGRLRGGVDIRTLGSGNAGGTNALRTQGKVFAFWVMLIDIAKGVLAVRVIAPMSLGSAGFMGSPPPTESLRSWLPVICGAAAILGHVYPIWYGFRGGKGVATLVGVLLGLDWALLLVALLAWVCIGVAFGYVGLASIASAVAVPLFVLATGLQPQAPLLTFGIAAAVLVLFTHRANIRRMRMGTEPRARRLWLFGRGRAS
ncbi:MAG: glycerol-3-phosphate 1-O-acyltransferase PlsY [Steroidobacteraceae bacterium]|nr:glycerol-3-phosphate 1-O-acyltransferase PlsY [Steroidobacteraceae bacterium]